MAKLVIVESPAKAKTIGKYLGPDYRVTASMGHIRDLPQSQLGIDVEHDYTPKYINIKGKEKLIRELKSEAKEADEVFLATDPDREGEAISWHLATLLGLDPDQPNRVTFGEITKKGVQEGMAHPRAIDKNLFNAQQARRILDRLVGYKLSPFLWRKVRRGLSAGRVQSVAVRLIVDREKEIEAFKPEEYWNLDAVLSAPGSQKKFTARLHGPVGGKKITVHNAEEAAAIRAAVEGKDYIVSDLTRGKRSRVPAPPFITSTMQQEASRRLGFTATRTMRAAQTLYEGVEIEGQGVTGLITYMRTDSLRIADEAAQAAKEFIASTYGEQYVCPTKRSYKTKSATAAQDAHEAVRPTNPAFTPDEADKSLSGDTAKLYRLIWSRFIASQMSDCQLDTVNASITAGDYLFKASGYVVTFDGFSVLYEEATDEKEKKETALPPLEQGQTLRLRELKSEQKFTQPPARYTEAALIKALEENGIGRPSTYAPIITTIIDRDYVERDAKKLKPTLLGRAINELMEEQFPDIVDVKFSAQMEKNLDKVESGAADWHTTIDQFYKGFDATLQQAEVNMEGKKIKVPDEESDEICEKCGRRMVIKTGRYGKFLACPGFPECTNTKKLVKDTGGVCPLCGSRILVRRSQKGRIYYGCEKNPACGFMTWDEPTAEKCEKCGGTLFKKLGKGAHLYCAREGCGFTKPLTRPGQKTGE
ncbi:MAG TPA: type I DNA topoisomerase [Candidatus Anaerofilum faecale]|nr:type I DNA topoisomerase [Anaerofilum sp. An201]OUP04804.1 DNA topoisomerase I [Anaerofilum sp. An201]HIX13272.1 type I DNA topoisomerase [Candidatus Anaerofilum faecale]